MPHVLVPSSRERSLITTRKMFQLPSFNVFSWRQGSGGTGSKGQVIQIPSVEIHDIETSPEKPTRSLKHLLRANHVNHSILFHDDQFHNHVPHVRVMVLPGRSS